MTFGKHKYAAKRTVIDGLPFPSKAEAAYYDVLKLLLKNGEIKGFIRQPTFTLGCPENVYRPDFLVFNIDGGVFAVDVKGFETSKFKRDVKLWRAYGPCKLSIIKGGKCAEIIERVETR